MMPPRSSAFVALVVVAAFAACDRPDWQLSDQPVAGSSTGGGGGVAASSSCAIDRSQGTMPVFAGQTVMNISPARREIYAYVTDAEADMLRSSRSLLPPTAVPNNAAVQQLNRAILTVSAERRPFVESLAQRFTRTRTAWPNPWALRLVSRPSSEHMNPVRIVLRKDAWIVRPEAASLTVVDVNNQVVTDAGPLEPGRVAAVFVLASSSAGSGCEAGFRELALGNEAMVESWELGSEAIASRLDGDIELLTKFFAIVRQCNEMQLNKGGTTFRSATVCSTWQSSVAATEYTTYGWSLSTPVEQYRPNLQNLTTLISALEGDKFEPNPFVVNPMGQAGAGGGGGGTSGAGGISGSGGMSGNGAGGLGGGGQGGALGDAGQAGATSGGDGGSP